MDPKGNPDVNYSAASTDYFAFMGANSSCYRLFYPGTPSSADLSGALKLHGSRHMTWITDGTSNTAMLSEMSARPWIYVGNGLQITSGTNESVHLLPQSISGAVFYALVTHADGEIVQGFEY